MKCWTVACLLFLSSLSVVVSGPIREELVLQPSLKKYNKKIGESLYIQCSPGEGVTENSVSDVKWLGPRGEIQELRSSESSDDPNKVRVYIERLDSGVGKGLYIKNIQESDLGWYNCTGIYGNSLLNSGAYLEPYLAIRFQDTPKEQHATLGQSGEIKCRVEARPPAEVEWAKNNKKLKSSEDGRVVVETGKIKLDRVEQGDEGVYKCIAKVLEKGDFKEMNINFRVFSPPEFETELQDQEAIEDKEKIIKCSAKGTPEPTYLWKDKENSDLSAKEGFSVNADGTLIIKQVKVEDAGKYTCVARNAASEVEQSFELEVIMKPKVVRYDNVTAEESKTAEIECSISGKPLPDVTLRKLSNSKPFSEGQQADDNRIVLSVIDEKKQNVRTVKLKIENVNRTDDGLYACEARNKGDKLYQNGHITVEYLPYFEKTYQENEAWSWNNKEVNLTCYTQAIPNATISWLVRDRGSVERPAENIRHITKHGQESVSFLEVVPVDSTYFRTYTCVARNKLGEIRKEIELKQARPPGLIQQVVFSVTTATTITFTFVGVADNGGRPVDAYMVQYKEQNKGWDDKNTKIWPIDDKRQVPFILENLKPRVTYAFRFRARNQVGFGDYGKTHTKTMPQEAEPLSPEISAKYMDEEKVETVKSSHNYELRWKVPKHNGKEIDKFDINIVEVDDNLKARGNMRTYEVRYPGTLVHDIEGLTPETVYKIELRAHNELGFSEPSTIYIRTGHDTRTDFDVSDGTGDATRTTVSSVTTQASVEERPETSDGKSPLFLNLSTPLVVLIVIALVLLILVLVDLICCCVNQVGCIWYLKNRLPEERKQKLEDNKGEKEPLKNDLKDEISNEKHDSTEPEKKPLSNDDVIVKSASKDSIAKDTAV